MANRKSQEPEEVTLNLIPIMNLFTALIPFLLLSAAFFHLSVIGISVPTKSDVGDSPTQPDKITLNLTIQPNSYELGGSSDLLNTQQKAKLHHIVQRPAATDSAAVEAAMAELSVRAKQVKGSFAASDTVIIVASADIPYEEVVGVMDAVRETTIERAGVASRVTLFPNVVLSSLVK